MKDDTNDFRVDCPEAVAGAGAWALLSAGADAL